MDIDSGCCLFGGGGGGSDRRGACGGEVRLDFFEPPIESIGQWDLLGFLRCACEGWDRDEQGSSEAHCVDLLYYSGAEGLKNASGVVRLSSVSETNTGII